MTKVELENKIKAHYPDCQVLATDLTGGGDHWQLNLKTKAFNDLSPVEQHQDVYKVLKEEMRGAIHALSLKTSGLES